MNNDIEKLIYLFSKLPGLGPRSSRRIILHLLQDKEVRLKNLIFELTNIIDKISLCETCYNLDTSIICAICNNEQRDNSIIAIVETVAELWAIERSNIFHGKYHVLGGVLSANNNHTTEQLKLNKLLARCLEYKVKEIIIATNATLDGQTTAYFITDYFKNYDIKISRLANGIPLGGELDYLDESTLSLAILQRHKMDL